MFYKVEWSVEDSLIFQILPKQFKAKQINLQKTEFDEIAGLEDKHLTLKVQFYNEEFNVAKYDLGQVRLECSQWFCPSQSIL